MTQVTDTMHQTGNAYKTLDKTLRKAAKKIAPLWPLESFVAVNPYMGMSQMTFSEVAQRLSKIGGGRMTLPVAFYQQALQDGYMEDQDVEFALRKHENWGHRSAQAFLANLKQPQSLHTHPAVASFTDTATKVTEQDFNQWTQDQISSWATVHFDQGLLAWNTSLKNRGIFGSWQADASVNRTPDVYGLKGYRAYIKSLPQAPLAAAQVALQTLGLPTVGIDLYLHRLLVRVQGWSAYTAYLDWQQELYEGSEGSAQVDFLAILLCVEAALKKSLAKEWLSEAWDIERSKLLHLTVEEQIDPLVSQNLILQTAYDHAAQRHWVQQFQQNIVTEVTPPKAQAVFCIDVRSEVYRRHLEHTSHEMETLGFAGFFAFPISYKPLGHSEARAQCPALLPSGPTVEEVLEDTHEHEQAVRRRQVQHQLGRAWKAMKKGAVSCFGYVSPIGLAYLPKLITDSLGVTRPVAHPDQEGIPAAQRDHKTLHLHEESIGLSLPQQVELAQNALRAMSLTQDFARLVLIVGHGANTVNNPHAAGLDCGACGGNAGEANARVAAQVLNNPEVRLRLDEVGIHVPDSTWFLACQHDTTTDEVSIFEVGNVPTTHKDDLKEVRTWLDRASRDARAERALRMGLGSSAGVDKAVQGRSKDWAQIRPEWGLAGCHAFVVAPRKRTQGLDLKGQSFLHSYRWHADPEFKVLELIMTAPMIVTSWINLQYYASTVDNDRFGAGNKTLHNVTAGLGVLEGSSGDLRTGLPWQSVHDGKQFQHLPVRLNVIIEAPVEAMNSILDRHPNVKQLLDNEWIFLWAMDDEGQVAEKYAGDLTWEPTTEYASSI